jgi:hypothetical protein
MLACLCKGMDTDLEGLENDLLHTCPPDSLHCAPIYEEDQKRRYAQTYSLPHEMEFEAALD